MIARSLAACGWEWQAADGVGYPDESFGLELEWLDHAKLKVAREVEAGKGSECVFDLGDSWQHAVWLSGRRAIRGRSMASRPSSPRIADSLKEGPLPGGP